MLVFIPSVVPGNISSNIRTKHFVNFSFDGTFILQFIAFIRFVFYLPLCRTYIYGVFQKLGIQTHSKVIRQSLNRTRRDQKKTVCRTFEFFHQKWFLRHIFFFYVSLGMPSKYIPFRGGCM